MEIQRRDENDTVVLGLHGRLDSYWAGHLAQELENIIRKGSDRITLDFANIEFMSSAGISVLLRFYKQLKEMNGQFRVVHPTQTVKTVMDLSGLSRFLLIAEKSVQAEAPAPRPTSRTFETERGAFEVFELDAKADMRCQVIGGGIGEGVALPDASVTVAFPERSFGVGVGAFGHGYDDCAERFGEFLSAAGASVYLPTDGKNVPDYLVSKGTLVPEMQVLTALKWHGEFSHLLRFDVREDDQTLTLQNLFDAARTTVPDRPLGFVMVAETSGLIGAALKRSPVSRKTVEPFFHYPSIRQRLTFTAEPAFARCSAIVSGVVVSSAGSDATAGILKPFGSESSTFAHIHAAAFSFHQLRKGKIDVHETVASLFEAESIFGVLHLIQDDRPFVGIGGSEFIRGAFWFGPIREFKAMSDTA